MSSRLASADSFAASLLNGSCLTSARCAGLSRDMSGELTSCRGVSCSRAPRSKSEVGSIDVLKSDGRRLRDKVGALLL